MREIDDRKILEILRLYLLGDSYDVTGPFVENAHQIFLDSYRTSVQRSIE